MSDDGFNFDQEREDTNLELAGKLQRLQALTAADIKAVLPDPGDQEEIKRLINAINAAANRNQKMALLQQNLAAGGAAIAKLIGSLR